MNQWLTVGTLPPPLSGAMYSVGVSSAGGTWLPGGVPELVEYTLYAGPPLTTTASIVTPAPGSSTLTVVPFTTTPLTLPSSIEPVPFANASVSSGRPIWPQFTTLPEWKSARSSEGLAAPAEPAVSATVRPATSAIALTEPTT